MKRCTRIPEVRNNRSGGFTLIELAVVLVILGFLIGGLLVPLATQVDQRNRRQTAQQLEEIRDALLGYVVTNGYLPCATTTNVPTNASYGVEDARQADGTCPAPVGNDGYVPWKTLGLDNAFDAWGSPRVNAGDPWTGYFRYRVDPAYTDQDDPIEVDTTPTAGLNLRVRNQYDTSDLTDITGANPQRPAVIIYSTGPDLTPNGRNAVLDADYQGGPPTPTFDDITIWVARPVLFSKIVSAGHTFP